MKFNIKNLNTWDWLKNASETHNRISNSARNIQNRFYLIISTIVGATVGIILSYFLIKTVPIESAGLIEAKKVGIISSAVNASYPKDLESFYYFSGLLITALIALVSAYICALLLSKKKNASAIITLNIPMESDNLSPIGSSIIQKDLFYYLLIPVVIFFLSFDINFFFKAWFAPWGFFGEEGMHYAWANELARGKVLYKDTLSFYGPLMSYSLLLIIKLFGPSILIFRIFCYCLYFLGFIIVYYLFRNIFQSKWYSILALTIFIVMYFPVLPAIHDTTFRAASGLASLLFIYKYIDSGKKINILFAGVMAGISLLFSNDAGIIAVISCMFVLMLSKNFRRIPRFIFGLMIPLIPSLSFFYVTGALSFYIRYMIDIPKYYSIGLFSRPFPNFENSVTVFLNSPSYKTGEELLKTLTAYWPIIFFLILLISLSEKFVFRMWEKKDIKVFGLLFFGILYFKVAFGMSGLDRNLFCLPPGMILAALSMKESTMLAKNIINSKKVRNRIQLFFIYSLFLLFLLSGIVGYIIWPGVAPRFFFTSLTEKFSLSYLSKESNIMEPINIERANKIEAPDEWAEHIRNIVNYIRDNTSETDYIYAFPREPVYYFLCDRSNPTRFINEFNAVTSDMRKELLSELEANKPAFIIYSYHYALEAPIPIEKRVPDVIEFINKNYNIEKDFGKAKILKLKGRS